MTARAAAAAAYCGRTWARWHCGGHSHLHPSSEEAWNTRRCVPASALAFNPNVFCVDPKLSHSSKPNLHDPAPAGPRPTTLSSDTNHVAAPGGGADTMPRRWTVGARFPMLRKCDFALCVGAPCMYGSMCCRCILHAKSHRRWMAPETARWGAVRAPLPQPCTRGRRAAFTPPVGVHRPLPCCPPVLRCFSAGLFACAWSANHSRLASNACYRRVVDCQFVTHPAQASHWHTAWHGFLWHSGGTPPHPCSPKRAPLL